MAPSGQYAVVTGASSGIGREISLLLAQEGYSLVLAARNQSALETLAAEIRNLGAETHVFVVDLSKPHAPEELYGYVEQRQLQVSVLVNNAGFGAYAPFAEADVQQMMEMIQVNVAAVTHLTRLFLPSMLACGQGRILNVASTAAFQPGPYMNVYFASKAYVLHFSEALAEEIKHTPVTVTALCPGPTQTLFLDRANMEKSGLVRPGKMMNAAQVAQRGMQAMLKGKRLAIPGLSNKLLSFGASLAPRRLKTWLAGKVVGNPND